MANCMSDEQREKIEKIQKDMLESTNMTKEEAYEFAFRCWQCGYEKEKEIRTKSIDDMKSEWDNRVKDLIKWCKDCRLIGLQQADLIFDEITEQMKL